MSNDIDDRLLRSIRAAAMEQPSALVDDFILRAARAQSTWQRRRRHLIPLAAAAGLALAFVGGSNLRRHEVVSPVVEHNALDPITAELLRIRPRIATSSAVEDFLLNPNAQPVSDITDTNEEDRHVE